LLGRLKAEEFYLLSSVNYALKELIMVSKDNAKGVVAIRIIDDEFQLKNRR